MRSTSHPTIWALGDCASIPGPDGKPYPYLAQHAMREGRLLARNIRAVLRNCEPKPFVYETLGIMASLGHHKGLGAIMGMRVRGFFAWWLRRSYYLMVMPRWRKRLRIVVDWTFALVLPPDLVKVNLAHEAELLRAIRRPGLSQRCRRKARKLGVAWAKGRGADGRPTG